MIRTWLRRLKRFFVVLLTLLLAFALFINWWVHTRVPMLDGTLQHEALEAPVRVARDQWGIPHISAENEPDAYFALGYVMAQDRLFQMDLIRRLAGGMLSEWLGPLGAGDINVPRLDAIARTFRLRAFAEDYMATNREAYPELMALSDAFCAGINFRIRNESLPPEYTALMVSAKPFTPVDCLSVAAILPITFADGIREDPLHTLLASKLDPEEVNLLFPGYSREVPVTIMESLEEAQAYLETQGIEQQPSGGRLAQSQALAPFLETWLASLDALTQAFGPAFGSNSWVVHGSRTESGMPILANDPHIGFTNPAIWYEAHIRFPGFDNYGFHLPLIPIPLLGHNEQRGWGLTMFAHDDVDLYVETFDPDDPNRVLYQGEWIDCEVITETIPVRFGSDREIAIRVTKHGPVLTDLFRIMMGYDGPDVAMRWTWQHVDYTDMQAFYMLSHANDLARFQEGVSLITSPGINVSYADAEGNIAWWAAGLIPIRAGHVNHKIMLDGASGTNEVLGYVPFDQNPQLINPEWGYVATANNMSTIRPVGKVAQLQGYWQPGDRAGRIEEVLDAREQWTAEACEVLQFDDTAWAAPRVTSILLDILADSGRANDPAIADAIAVLESWDYAHDVDSIGASIYQMWTSEILRMMLEDEMGEQAYRIYGTLADHWNFFKWGITQPQLSFWDNVSTDGPPETRDVIVGDALVAALAWLETNAGDAMADWRWGSLHTMEHIHPLGLVPGLASVFNVGPLEASGGAQIVNNMLYSSGSGNFHVIAGPSTRRVIDFADPKQARAVLPTGNSGNFMSPHFDDQAELFIRGGFRRMLLDSEAITVNTKHVLLFEPAA